ncbi:MAG: NAD(P)(+) transhydrogenase (Re/Si-specific) subunit beta [Acidobacteria bacterium]|nr:NAD(P)(+) transhydrogenase (Re/Si-specific) subunit beta [Acidobacteriota bacterium]
MGLAHPRTAVRGNLLGALGMLIAAVVTLLARGLDFGVIVAGVLVGSLAGALLAYKIRMTAMPQMVALLNGFGGGASTLVAGAALAQTASPDLQSSVATAATGLVGAVTFWGSLVAFAKLQEFLVSGRQVLFGGQKALNALLGLASLLCCAWVVAEPTSAAAYCSLVAVASVLGVLLVIPIGGADMPVVISLLNSYSGIAGATSGFVLSNTVLIIAGALVGASGIILSRIMCKAMNRSLTNVLFGVLGPASGAASEDEVYAGKVKATSPEEVAMLLSGARRVVIVPGYGMAVAQAQHAVRSLANLIESKGAEVEFAIHPVAGRMPGHMNVLLAEADVPYDKLKEMDVINPSFPQTDVVLVIGANDVVNPLARTDPACPIAGMPILDVDKARTVVVIKRSLGPGFAGIPNPLFAADNALMLFQDGRKAIQDLIAAVKES